MNTDFFSSPFLLKGLHYVRTILWSCYALTTIDGRIVLSALSGISWTGLKWLSSSTIGHQFPRAQKALLQSDLWKPSFLTWLRLKSAGCFDTAVPPPDILAEMTVRPVFSSHPGSWRKAAFCAQRDNLFAQLSSSSCFKGQPTSQKSPFYLEILPHESGRQLRNGMGVWNA